MTFFWQNPKGPWEVERVGHDEWEVHRIGRGIGDPWFHEYGERQWVGSVTRSSYNQFTVTVPFFLEPAPEHESGWYPTRQSAIKAIKQAAERHAAGLTSA